MVVVHCRGVRTALWATGSDWRVPRPSDTFSQDEYLALGVFQRRFYMRLKLCLIPMHELFPLETALVAH